MVYLSSMDMNVFTSVLKQNLHAFKAILFVFFTFCYTIKTLRFIY